VGGGGELPGAKAKAGAVVRAVEVAVGAEVRSLGRKGRQSRRGAMMECILPRPRLVLLALGLEGALRAAAKAAASIASERSWPGAPLTRRLSW
jgi:hypothetical protein